MAQWQWWSALQQRFGGPTEEQRAALAEIDRIAAETKSTLPLATRYRRRLMAPLTQALEATRQAVDQIPGPVDLDPDRWQADMALRALFVTPQEMRAWLKSQPSLAPLFASSGAEQLFALLVGQHRQRLVFVTEQSGEITRRDVPRRSSSFDDLRLMAAGAKRETVRGEVVHRILMTAFIQALEQITEKKEVKERLQKEHELLEFVVNTADPATGRGVTAARAAGDSLAQVHRRLDELGREAESPEGQLAHIAGALTDLATRVHVRPVTFHLNGAGTLVSTAAAKDSIGSCLLAECRFTGPEPQVGLWVSVRRGAAGPA